MLYSEFSTVAHARRVVLALEVGGRWSSQDVSCIRFLPRACARNGPASSRENSLSAYTQQWSALLSFAVARSFAASILSLLSPAPPPWKQIRPPPLSDLLADARPPFASRMLCAAKAWTWLCVGTVELDCRGVRKNKKKKKKKKKKKNRARRCTLQGLFPISVQIQRHAPMQIVTYMC